LRRLPRQRIHDFSTDLGVQRLCRFFEDILPRQRCWWFWWRVDAGSCRDWSRIACSVENSLGIGPIRRWNVVALLRRCWSSSCWSRSGRLTSFTLSLSQEEAHRLGGALTLVVLELRLQETRQLSLSVNSGFKVLLQEARRLILQEIRQVSRSCHAPRGLHLEARQSLCEEPWRHKKESNRSHHE